MNDTREELAAYAHEAWSGWMKYMLGKCKDQDDGTVVVPADLVKRWKFQMETPYDKLPDDMKPSDRDEADKMLKIMDKRISELEGKRISELEGKLSDAWDAGSAFATASHECFVQNHPDKATWVRSALRKD